MPSLGVLNRRGGRPFNLTTVRLGSQTTLGAWSRGGAEPQWRCSQTCGVDAWSGSPLVLVDESAQDVATSNGIAGRRDEARDRLRELQATVWSRLVVVADVLVEHRFEMSP
jgi:hypothetical protein